MENDSASFWGDIKEYEERLARDPDSLLFARLAEIYLKVGLVDDALHIARQGAERHPGYIAGQRVLAHACHAKGLEDECRAALERVTVALPEDGDAQKMLGRILAAKGNNEAAVKAFRTALEFNPDDVGGRVELESLERCMAPEPAEEQPVAQEPWRSDLPVADTMDADFAAFEDEAGEPEEIIEDLEILELDESDLLELDEMEEPEEEAEVEPPATGEPGYDPLSTVTLAELYAQQGFTDKALTVYRSILAHDPDNAGIRSRIALLEAGLAVDAGSISAGSAGEAAISESVCEEPSPAAPSPLPARSAEVVAILEGWLGNIGRLKQCR